MRRKLLLLTAALLLVPMVLAAQSAGTFSGSLESQSIFGLYQNSPSQGFHSNNYLKLDYRNGRFSTGLQAEFYPSPLPGYDQAFKGVSLPIKYVSWQAKNWSLTAGDYYEQLGSGLLLRSWEDRSLGLSNPLGGLRFKGSLPHRGLSLSLLAGVPRQAGIPWGYASTLVGGADLQVEPLLLFGAADSPVGFTLGASLLDRWEWAPEADLSLLLGSEAPRNVLLHAVRAGFSAGGFQLNAEYVGKGRDFTAIRHNGTGDTYSLEPGRAFSVEASWAGGNLSVTGSWRYLDNMALRAHRTLGTLVPSNTLNYLPALCQQQTYMLATLNPYETYAEGEWGLQADAFYNFRRGTVLGGKYGMTLHIGGSWINALGKVLPRRDRDHLAYRDLNIELTRNWSRRFHTTLFVSIQENSPTHGNRNATEAQNVFVLDTRYQFSSKLSLRTELQYLYSQERGKDWMAALIEVNIAPQWSFSISDMYNHGSTKQHYWNVSASWSRNAFKCILGYGRSREGMVCSGGVCRWQPEYMGVLLRLQYAF